MHNEFVDYDYLRMLKKKTGDGYLNLTLECIEADMNEIKRLWDTWRYQQGNKEQMMHVVKCLYLRIMGLHSEGYLHEDMHKGIRLIYDLGKSSHTFESYAETIAKYCPELINE